MNDIDIMEQNLARLLSEHLSQPSLDTTEPADPFQKRTFGRKMRKSAVSLAEEPRTNSLPRLDIAAARNAQPPPEPKHREQEATDEEAEMYMREVEVLMARLRVGLERVEENCRQKLQRTCATTTGRQRQQKAETLLGDMEASVDFVLNDCFAFESKPGRDKENRQDRDNRDSRDNRENRERENREREHREVRESKAEGRQGRKGSVGGSRAKPAQRSEKSIYESVLEQRKLRRSKKRMI